MDQTHKPSGSDELPPIPAKRYFTIGEVSELCAVKPHVLRYWEQEFNQLKPVKSCSCGAYANFSTAKALRSMGRAIGLTKTMQSNLLR